jgi:DNA-binding response OmpR family regulator
MLRTIPIVSPPRSKVEPDPRSPAFIHTIRDIGYRFDPGQDNHAD